MRKSNFALRLQPSLLEDARRTAEEEGVALNQLINVAVAEKVSAIRTESYFRERARRANIPAAIELLKRMGDGNPPMKGDELPAPEKLSRSAPNRRRRNSARKPTEGE
ncbi:MAG TPA: toxin-antitoxin system HicB family antitoxin [Terriglobia bacterium]|nr:toxin-antitoxin system HicB family antitoxin [Terriglobia bacterium]